MTEPILSAVPAPASWLKRTRNAGATVRLLESFGWSVTATVAIGWTLPKSKTKKAVAAEVALADMDSEEEIEVLLPPEVVASILVRARKDGVRIAASWAGEPGESLGFDGAYVLDRCATSMNYTEMNHYIKGTKPSPTARDLEILQEEAESMMSAVNMFMPIGTPIGVLRLGSSTPGCKGRAKINIGWAPCANQTESVVCDDCVPMIFEGGKK